MTDTSSGDALTPPGPPAPPEPPEPPEPPDLPRPTGGLSVDDWLAHRQSTAAAPPPPPGPPLSSFVGRPGPAPMLPARTDKPLGWTALGLTIPLCVPFLPLAGLALAVITLARKRFRPRWVAVLALLLGLAGTGLQVAVVASPAFWDGIRDGLDDSLEDQADDARRSGEPTEIVPAKLRDGDCFLDPALKGIGDEQIMTDTVTLLPCREKHDLEVFATLKVPGRDYPGQRAIDDVAAGCFPRFRTFVGRTYGESGLEVYYYFPTERSWRLLGDRTVTCVTGHPDHQVRGTLEGSRR